MFELLNQGVAVYCPCPDTRILISVAHLFGNVKDVFALLPPGGRGRTPFRLLSMSPVDDGTQSWHFFSQLLTRVTQHSGGPLCCIV